MDYIAIHFAPPYDKFLTEKNLLDSVRTTFSGTVVVRKDLSQFELEIEKFTVAAFWIRINFMVELRMATDR